ncbi:MAG TPA: hypothetical protein VFZ84_04450 [Burkholderiales bacterium]
MLRLRSLGPGDLFIVPEGEQGCWASFFSGKEYRPPGVQFTGRTYIESFEPKAQAVVEPPLQQVAARGSSSRPKAW